MKRISLFILLGIFASACDVIEEPYITGNNDGGQGSFEILDEDFEIENVVQKVLLEEFTGHQCPNCPEGAITAYNLHNFYGDKFITIAYHAGFFARTSSEFPTDYRTSEGNALNTEFGVSSYPAGVINRTKVNSNLVLGNSLWPQATDNIIDNTPKLGIEIIHVHDEDNISVTIRLQTFYEIEPLRVCVFITEDNLISPQITPEGVVDDYEHNHVFRTSLLNETWGIPIFTEGANSGLKMSFRINRNIDASWNTSNLNIVCFAYDEITGEVLQAEQVAL